MVAFFILSCINIGLKRNISTVSTHQVHIKSTLTPHQVHIKSTHHPTAVLLRPISSIYMTRITRPVAFFVPACIPNPSLLHFYDQELQVSSVLNIPKDRMVLRLCHKGHLP